MIMFQSSGLGADSSSFEALFWRKSTRRKSPSCRNGGVVLVVAVVACLCCKLGLLNSFVSHTADAAPRCGRVVRHAAAETAALLEGRASLRLIKDQTKAGSSLREAGAKLAAMSFEGKALEDKIHITMDGHQNLREVDIAEGALAAAGDNDGLAKAILSAMQVAHDKSTETSKNDIWDLYRDHSSLLQAPLGQIGIGNTAEDLWANVTKTNETLKLAEELFLKFDVDLDGYWNLEETRNVQKATEGTDMTDDAFTMLVIAAAPNSGRDLSEDDLAKGLSKLQVIELYTDADRQRNLGFVLNVRKDHASVFAAENQAASEQEADSEG